MGDKIARIINFPSAAPRAGSSAAPKSGSNAAPNSAGNSARNSASSDVTRKHSGGGSQFPSSNVTAHPRQNSSRNAPQISFERKEFLRILDLYGRMVTAGEWRDYVMEFARDRAVFAAFRRSAERPQMRIEKRPALRNRQGMWTLFGEHGQVLKRGEELALVLAPLERRLMKAVES